MSLRKYFDVTEDNHLTLHEVDLIDLCVKYGTPLFVFDEDSIVDNFERFRLAFESNYPKVIVCYSVKTNFSPAICKVIREKDGYAEVTSEMELYVAEKAGFSSDHIIFDGPYKPNDILQKALKKEVLLINVESFDEMERLNRIAGKMGVKQAIGLRVNTSKVHSFSAIFNPRNILSAIKCHPEYRFGFSSDDAYSAFKKATKMNNLSVEGIMTHPYHRSVKTLSPIIHEIYQKLGVEMRYLNVGGGFEMETTRHVRYMDLVQDLIKTKLGLRSALDEKAKSSLSIELIAKTITDSVKENLGDLPEPTIVTEPGSIIVGPSGIILLRVDHAKRVDGLNWVIVDDGTNLIPSINEYSRHDILVANRATDPPEEISSVAGPLCYTDDYLAVKTYLPQIHADDILSILDCGAYSLSSSNQFLYPRPTVLLLNSRKEVKVIREKETFEDVFRKDRLPRSE
ncbi:MAG: hypothetical protein OEZ48_12335 [Candidatus Bathyarchaeota archaeon]|nr:hypothetical protein [Candidatus Bathyarchaeota archaeon]